MAAYRELGKRTSGGNLVVSPLGGLRHTYVRPAVAYRTSPGVAAHELVALAPHIFVGARVDGCGASTPPVRDFQVGLAALCLVVLWPRRKSLVALAKGRLTALVRAIDFVLAVAVQDCLRSPWATSTRSFASRGT